MKIITGRKEDFFNFLENLKETDKIGIITHIDLDGFTSAIIINEILKMKSLKYDYLKFIDYKKGIFSELKKEFDKKKINKIFISDISLEIFKKDLKDMKKNLQFFIIDHHPSLFKNEKNIIKTVSEDCTSFVLFNLMNEYIKRYNKECIISKERLKFLRTLTCATMISEISYKKKSNFLFIKKFYPKIKVKTIYNSYIGKICQEISSAILVCEKDKEKIFNLINKNKIKEFSKYRKEVDREINYYLKKFNKEKIELKKNLYFYYLKPKPKFSISSIISTTLSLKEKEKTFIICSDSLENPMFVKISARNQSGKINVNLLMKKGIKGLKNANGGGHFKASAAKFLKKDLERFKKNLIS
jgi:single-stranded DNA-specific DHH superfamily exonuclease